MARIKPRQIEDIGGLRQIGIFGGDSGSFEPDYEEDMSYTQQGSSTRLPSTTTGPTYGDQETSIDTRRAPTRMSAPEVPTFGDTVREDVGAIDRRVSRPDEYGSDLGSLWEQANKIYTPETASRDRFNDLLGRFPERGNPGLLRGLSAIGMGIGAKTGADALKVMDAAMYAPYYRDVSSWKEQTDPQYKAAELENRANINERTLVGNLLTSQAAAQRVEAQERYQNERNRIQEQKNADTAENNRIRSEAYAFRQMHPDWKINFDGPNVIAVSPDGKRSVTLGPTGKMSEIDKVNLQGEWREAAAKALSQGRQAVVDAQGWIVLTDPSGRSFRLNERTGQKEWISGITGPPTRPGVPPRTGGAAPNDLPNTNAELQFKLKSILRGNPTARKYIVPNESGDLGFQEPDNTGKTPAQINQDWTEYKNILRQVDPQAAADLDRHNAMKPGSSGGGGGGGWAPSDDMVKVRAPDGSIRMVPRNKVAEATSPQRGGKVVP